MPFMEESLEWPLSRVLPIMQERIMQGSKYHGIPTLKSPLDFWIYQEILWETKPDVIIEIGNFFGGSILALAHVCDSMNKGRILGIDTSHDRVDARVRTHPRISLLTGDACDIFQTVERAVDGDSNVMIIEDSSHTYENTLKVLEGYSRLVGVGHYFIVEDGICHHGLDVGPAPGPYEAVETFIQKQDEFVIDRAREAYCVTWNPRGYLKKIGRTD